MAERRVTLNATDRVTETSPLSTNRRRCPGALLVVLALALPTLVVVATPSRAAAETPAHRIARLREQAHRARVAIDRFGDEVGELVERYNTNQVALERTVAAEAANRRRLVEAGERLAKAQAQLDARARSVYTIGAAPALGSFLEARDFHELAAAERYQHRVVDADALALAGVLQARADLAEVGRRLAEDRRGQQRIRAALATQRAAIERRLADQRAYLARLNAQVKSLVEQERRHQEELRRRALARRLAAERRARAAAARARARAAARAMSRGDRWRDAPSVGGRGAGRLAARWALGQVGKPYRWGASGPGSFDCSGLTMRAWAAAGVSLPRTSRGQWTAGSHLGGLLGLRPGDLLFFGGSPATIHHVGLYVGGGRMVEAPYTGASVRVVSVGRGDLVGTVRP